METSLDGMRHHAFVAWSSHLRLEVEQRGRQNQPKIVLLPKSMSEFEGMGASGGEQVLDDPVELEHSIGYSGKFTGTVVHHPNEGNIIIHDIGSIVVIADVDDPYVASPTHHPISNPSFVWALHRCLIVVLRFPGTSRSSSVVMTVNSQQGSGCPLAPLCCEVYTLVLPKPC
jgi:hypothetical protein